MYPVLLVVRVGLDGGQTVKKYSGWRADLRMQPEKKHSEYATVASSHLSADQLELHPLCIPPRPSHMVLAPYIIGCHNED
jgi:hypothetical protein